MTHKDRILNALSRIAVPLCDDCLAKVADISPRQTVYQNCTALAKAGLIERGQGECALCGKVKKVSWTGNLMDPSAGFHDAAGVKRGGVSSSDHKMKSDGTFPWFWEGNVQAKLVTYLAGCGYSIRSVADTISRTRGKDIVALTPEGRELWVSVKGFPENSPNTQARHWFAQAVFDVILYRSENRTVELALALPYGFPTYERLTSRISWLRAALPLKIFWVDESGNVREA